MIPVRGTPQKLRVIFFSLIQNIAFSQMAFPSTFAEWNNNRSYKGTIMEQ